jgi:hypothetical protein
MSDLLFSVYPLGEFGRLQRQMASVFAGFPAACAPRHMRVTEKSCRRMSEQFVGRVLAAIRALANGEIVAPAWALLAANDREGHDDAVSYFLPLCFRCPPRPLRPFMHEAIEQMQVRTADRRRRYLYDCISRMFNPGIR